MNIGSINSISSVLNTKDTGTVTNLVVVQVLKVYFSLL